MNLDGSIALVTGANRGLGAVFTAELLDRGAAKVYAAVRDPELASDVTLLVNNAGVSTGTSALSWFTLPTTGGYSSAKAAMWAATNSLRQNLQEQGTLVTAVHAGFIDTDMAAAVDAPKVSPESVVAATLDAVAAGEHEVLADDVAQRVKSGLSGPVTGLYPALA